MTNSSKPKTVEDLEHAIEKALSQKLTSVEKGRIYSEALITYLKIKNEIDTAYLETLENSMQMLGKLMEEEKTQNDEIQKESIRKKLQEIEDMD
jgi:hypothetical protein